LGVEVIQDVDVNQDASINSLSERLGERPIDVLVNNAGILRRETLDDLDVASMREQFDVNALGPLRVTAALRHGLANPSKVAIITSRMGSIADNTSGTRYGYRMSKAAVNIAGVSLAHDLRGQGVSVAILHPGFVKTDMTGGAGFITAEVAARGLIQRIDELSPENTGTFWHSDGSILPW
jgi:short-subunit dehydrogenase